MAQVADIPDEKRMFTKEGFPIEERLYKYICGYWGISHEEFYSSSLRKLFWKIEGMAERRNEDVELLRVSHTVAIVNTKTGKNHTVFKDDTENKAVQRAKALRSRLTNEEKERMALNHYFGAKPSANQ